MGTVKNNNKWAGACVGGKVVSGLVKNGEVFYKKPSGYFLVEYIDTNDMNYSIKFSDRDSLYELTRSNDELKNCKVTSVDNISLTTTNLMFAYCSNLTDLDLSNLNTSNVESMSNMFYSCSKLTNLNLNNFNTSKVTSMYYMFGNCGNLTSFDLSSFDTSNVTDMSYMFYGNYKLLSGGLTNLNLSNFNTSNVTTMRSMFEWCANLTNLDISSFDFSKVTDSTNMFAKVPSDCLIKVKDQTAKDFVLGVRSDLTNVVIV